MQADAASAQAAPKFAGPIGISFTQTIYRAARVAFRPNVLLETKLKLAITAGIGYDHVDLQAAIDCEITVAEVTYCNSISVSEHVVMMILSLVRNHIPSYQWVVMKGWNIADCVTRSYELGHGGGDGRRRPHRPHGAAPPQALRRQAPLHRRSGGDGEPQSHARWCAQAVQMDHWLRGRRGRPNQLQSLLCHRRNRFPAAGDLYGRDGKFDGVGIEGLLDQGVGTVPYLELLTWLGHHLH